MNQAVQTESSTATHDEVNTQPVNGSLPAPEQPQPPADRSMVWMFVTLSLAAVVAVTVAVVVVRLTGDLRYSLGCGAAAFSITATLLTLAHNADIGI